MRRQERSAEQRVPKMAAKGAILRAGSSSILAVVLSLAPCAVAGDSTLERLLHDRRIQSHLPGKGTVEDGPKSGSVAHNEPRGRDERETVPRNRGRREPSVDESETRGGSGAGWNSSLDGFASIVVKILIAVGVLTLVCSIVARIRLGRSSQAGSRGPRAHWSEPRRAQEGTADESRGDAAALAKEGRYAEAIRALLLESIAHLSSTRAIALPRSSTSRELVIRLGLDADHRSGFERLVLAVERGVFGELPIDRDEYEACAKICESLTAKGRAP